jgi:hypothetical protein
LLARNGLCLGAVCGAVVLLRNLVDWEVADVDVRRQLGLKWSTNLAKLVPDDASEERMSFDRRSTIVSPAIIAETVFGIAQEADIKLVAVFPNKKKGLPSDHVLSLGAQGELFGEEQGLSPIDNLAIRIVSILGTEWWPSYQTFEHDGTDRPPVAQISITLTQEDLWCDVVWCSNRRVGHMSS